MTVTNVLVTNLFLILVFLAICMLMNRKSKSKNDNTDNLFFEVPSLAVMELNRRCALLLRETTETAMSACKLAGDFHEGGVTSLRKKIEDSLEKCGQLNGYLTKVRGNTMNERMAAIQIRATMVLNPVKMLLGSTERILRLSCELAEANTDNRKPFTSRLYRELVCGMEETLEHLSACYQTGEAARISTYRAAVNKRNLRLYEARAQYASNSAWVCMLSDFEELLEYGNEVCDCVRVTKEDNMRITNTQEMR